MNFKKLIGARIILTIRSFDSQDKEIVPRITKYGTRDAFSIVAKVVDYDNFGIWIEKENYPIYNKEQNKREKLLAHVLIKYEYISSIAAFPDNSKEGLYTQTTIGFDIDDD